MQAEIFKIDTKIIVGIPIEMSLIENKTGDVFRSFMPRRNEVVNRSNMDVLDLKLYGSSYFQKFNPTNTFIKWAGVEVDQLAEIPGGMDTYTIEEGVYAMFMNHGLEENSNMFQYIFTEWLPSSEYVLDDRPHFDVLGEDYQKREEDAMSEIWVPVKFREYE